METCPACGTSLTEEMLETGYCYGCGEELLTHKELHSAVLEAQKSKSIRLQEAASAKKAWEDTIKRSNNSQYYEYRVMTVLDTKIPYFFKLCIFYPTIKCLWCSNFLHNHIISKRYVSGENRFNLRLTSSKSMYFLI